MYVLAGPNGAGKSTLYELRLKPITGAPFINADQLLEARAANGETLDAYQAAAIAADIRDRHLDDGVSFVTETVFSHPSKIELVDRAQAAGFRVVLYHVNVSRPEISVARVRWRASQGGHDVPEDKIRERYTRNQRHIRDAAARADLTEVFDASRANAPPRWVLTLKHGQIYSHAPDVPAWAKALYDVV